MRPIDELKQSLIRVKVEQLEKAAGEVFYPAITYDMEDEPDFGRLSVQEAVRTVVNRAKVDPMNPLRREVAEEIQKYIDSKSMGGQETTLLYIVKHEQGEVRLTHQQRQGYLSAADSQMSDHFYPLTDPDTGKECAYASIRLTHTDSYGARNPVALDGLVGDWGR